MATKSEKRDARIVLHVTRDVRKRLERLARVERRSLAAMARALVEHGLEEMVPRRGGAGTRTQP